eukprot:5645775-Prorocentrum_lima.AAC.1
MGRRSRRNWNVACAVLPIFPLTSAMQRAFLPRRLLSELMLSRSRPARWNATAGHCRRMFG